MDNEELLIANEEKKHRVKKQIKEIAELKEVVDRLEVKAANPDKEFAFKIVVDLEEFGFGDVWFLIKPSMKVR